MSELKTLSPADLQAIRERAERATPGPWDYTYDGFINGALDRICQTWDKFDEDFENPKANGSFIAHARTDIPALLAYIQVLEADRDEWRALDTAKGEVLFEIAKALGRHEDEPLTDPEQVLAIVQEEFARREINHA